MSFPNYPHIPQTTACSSDPAQMSHSPVCEQFPGSPNPSQPLPSSYHTPLWHVSHSMITACGLLSISSSEAQHLSDHGALPEWMGMWSQVLWSLLHKMTASTHPHPQDLQSLVCAGQPGRAPHHVSLPESDQGCKRSPKPFERCRDVCGGRPGPAPPQCHKGDFSLKRKHLSLFLKFPSISPCHPLS